jgi:hypothetical protein
LADGDKLRDTTTNTDNLVAFMVSHRKGDTKNISKTKEVKGEENGRRGLG